MTVLERIELPTPTARFCYWCRCWVTVGCHDSKGRFDPCSVPVSDEEVGASAERRFRLSGNWPGPGMVKEIRYNIALGKHLSVR